MNILEILSAVEERDPEIFERLSTRRTAMRSFAGLGKKLSLTALPLALGAMFQKAYGQTPNPSVLDVLNFALTLEYFESEFYETGLAASGLIPQGAGRMALTVIAQHESQHVAFLKAAITASGGTPIAKPTFDLSGGGGSGNGPFATALTDYNVFLAVAQVLEDTGVRAYKGQAGNLQGAPDILEAALNIHSVEARHAAHLREMRAALGAPVKPWITLNQPGLGALDGLAAANYAGEELTTQATVNIIGIGGNASIDAEAASESFDEPLTMAQVLMIVDPFIV